MNFVFEMLRLSDDTIVDRSGVEYTVGDTTLSVLGLAELGHATESTDDPCYAEDRDNYIDIVLRIDGDSSVVVEFQAFENKGLYNPGGPGTVNLGSYTGEGHPQIMEVTNDETNDMIVSWCAAEDGIHQFLK